MSASASALLARLLARGKFRHVQVLLRLVELGSVQRAADSIGVRQSSVTQALAYLESLLEVVLFERHARGVRPTQACRDLLPAARQLMHGLADTTEVVAARRRRAQGTVRLMASVAAMQGLLVRALPAFAAEHPDIVVTLVESEGQDQMQVIARGEVDLAICRRRPVFPDHWAFETLFDDHMAVVCSAIHPLRKIRAPDGATLAAQTWLLMPAGTEARAGFDALAATLPSTPATFPVVTRSLDLISTLLREQPLCAFLPAAVIRLLLASGALHEVDARLRVGLEPMGLLRPRETGTAAAALGAFLARQCAARATDTPAARRAPAKAPRRQRSTS